MAQEVRRQCTLALQGVVPESEQASVNESEIQYEALQRAGQVMDYDYVNPSRDM